MNRDTYNYNKFPYKNVSTAIYGLTEICLRLQGKTYRRASERKFALAFSSDVLPPSERQF